MSREPRQSVANYRSARPGSCRVFHALRHSRTLGGMRDGGIAEVDVPQLRVGEGARAYNERRPRGQTQGAPYLPVFQNNLQKLKPSTCAR